MTDPFDFWRRRLAGEVVPIDDSETAPQSGFYRLRTRDRIGFDPVAYWWEGDKLFCVRGKEQVADGEARRLWSYASQDPITYEVYTSVVDGGAWPDLHAAVTRSNMEPPADTLEAIRDRIEDLAREAKKLMASGAAKTQDVADQASDLAAALLKLQKKADTKRKSEVQPYLDGQREVNDRWREPIDEAGIYANLKAVVLTPFLVKQKAEQEEKRRDAERKAAEAAKTGNAEAEEVARREANIASAARAHAGSRSRTTALRTYKVVVIEDRAALLAHFAEHAEITKTLQALAESTVRAGTTPPGAKVVDEQRAA